jgi:hypothetical protein
LHYLLYDLLFTIKSKHWSGQGHGEDAESWFQSQNDDASKSTEAAGISGVKVSAPFNEGVLKLVLETSNREGNRMEAVGDGFGRRVIMAISSLGFFFNQNQTRG